MGSANFYAKVVFETEEAAIAAMNLLFKLQIHCRDSKKSETSLHVTSFTGMER